MVIQVPIPIFPPQKCMSNQYMDLCLNAASNTEVKIGNYLLMGTVRIGSEVLVFLSAL